MDPLIRTATRDDAPAISRVIIAALRESNAQDYSQEIIDLVEQSFSPAALLQLLTQRRVYVATIERRIVATASLDREVVRSVFVDPPHQGTGIGKKLMETLESVAINESLQRLRVPSSITAEGFYASLASRKSAMSFTAPSARSSWRNG